MLDLQVAGVKGMVWDHLKNEFRKDGLVINKAEVVILARPPKFMESLTDASVELNIAIVANNYRLKVSGAKVTLAG